MMEKNPNVTQLQTRDTRTIGAIIRLNPLSPSAPYFFFTCLTPDDFTRQWGSSAA